MKCPECLLPLYLQDWYPGPGFDPRIRKYLCLGCRTDYYIMVAPRQKAQEGSELFEIHS